MGCSVPMMFQLLWFYVVLLVIKALGFVVRAHLEIKLSFSTKDW